MKYWCKDRDIPESGGLSGSARFQRAVFGILPNTQREYSRSVSHDAKRSTLEACAPETSTFQLFNFLAV